MVIVDVEDVDGWGFVALLYFFFSAVILHGCLPREYVSVDYFGVVDDDIHFEEISKFTELQIR